MEAHAGHEHQRRRHHPTVREVVLDVRVARKVLRQVGRQKCLEGSGEPPEIRDLDEQLTAGPERGRRDKDRHVAQLQRQWLRTLARLSAACREEDPPADLIRDEDQSQAAEPHARPLAREHDKDRGRRGDDQQRADVLGRKKLSHRQPDPGSSHSGLTPSRWKLDRRGTNQR